MISTPSQFEPELREFDRAAAPLHANVFYGSSSFRLWEDMAEAFPGKAVVNRGFGGSTLSECIQLLPRVIYPLLPGTMILYAGDNDLDQGASPEHVVYLLGQFLEKIRTQFPALPIAYISVKPSPSRFWNIVNIRRANELVSQAVTEYPGVTYLDVFQFMLSPTGGPRPDLFSGDGLHMNSTGYALWAKVIREWLGALPGATGLPSF